MFKSTELFAILRCHKIEETNVTKPSSVAKRSGAALAVLTLMALIPDHGWADDSATFHLFPNQPFKSCFGQPGHKAKVIAEVTPGNLNDTLVLNLSGFKPNLNFDLFTVEKSNQLANGSPDPGFTNFGFAWYQSEVHINAEGTGQVKIKTILLDEIFGFDPVVSLAPTNTFHVGFWFDNPADAAPCGFTGFTPFNGEHHAGPVAFITRPDAATNLGPLCTNPTGGPPFACNP
jgi:hypothetical protein